MMKPLDKLSKGAMAEIESLGDFVSFRSITGSGCVTNSEISYNLVNVDLSSFDGFTIKKLIIGDSISKSGRIDNNEALLHLVNALYLNEYSLNKIKSIMSNLVVDISVSRDGSYMAFLNVEFVESISLERVVTAYVHSGISSKSEFRIKIKKD